jgi:hypothetical protein
VLISVPPEHRYTQVELVESAARNGYPISTRLFTDWVSKGLLDRPERKGLGRGRGTIATWPETQRQLLLALLNQRARTPAFDGLCNLPVFAWLYFGDVWVPLRQIRRTLLTWATAATGAPQHLARARADEHVRAIAHPRATPRDRKALARALAKQLWTANYSGRIDTFEELRPLFERVTDPESTGRPRGPIGAPLDAATTVSILEARRLAVARLKIESGSSSLPDGLFHWARCFFLRGLDGYGNAQPMLAMNPEVGSFFPQLDLDKLAGNACLDLVTVLGMGLQVPHEAHFVDSLADPRTWEKRRINTRIARTQGTGTGLGISLEVNTC